MARALLTAAVVLAAIAYPLLVWLGLTRLEPRTFAFVLAAIALARAAVSPQPVWRWAAGGALVLALLAGLGNAWLPLKLWPVLVNAVLLAVFGASLLHGPTVVERIARLREPDLPPEGVRYTRRVTQAWCGFFVVNGGIALATTLFASDRVWALYNGLIAYGLIGAFFAIEWLVRQRVRAAAARAPLAGTAAR